MKQRPILIAVIGYIIGILVGLYLQKSIVPFYVLIAVIFYLYKIFSQKIFTQRSQKFKLLSIKRYFRYVKLNFNSSVILILIISSIFSNSIVIFQNNNYQKIYSKLEENKTLKLEAIVISSKESKKYYDRYIIETVYNKQKIKLYINVKGADLEYGDKIQTTGEYIRPEKQRNYKGFDYSEYLKQLKIYGTIQTTNIKILRKNNANNFLCIVNKISNIIEEKVKNNISEECSSILLGLILGKTDSIEEEIKQNFRNASMSHILAISGMHVSYLLIGIRVLFNKSLGKRKTSIISIVFLIFYMFLTNFSPSITRAGVMSILLLFSKLVYRNNDTYTSLSLALLILLVYNPFLINNLGLQLSFGGVLGIVLLNKYEKFLELVREKNINLKCVEAGNKVNIEKNLYFDVLWPYSKRMISENAINNNSLVCKLVYKNFSILFTGDIEKIAENEILDMYSNRLYLLKSNILKVAHHGSKTSSIKEFVERVSPQYALIGVGKNNKFGHPSDGTIKNLKDEKIKIYRTDEMGEIFINTNGKIINKLMYKNSNKSK